MVKLVRSWMYETAGKHTGCRGCLGSCRLLENWYPAKGRESMQKKNSILKVRYKAAGKEKRQTFPPLGNRNI